MIIASESEITRHFDGITVVKARELERKGQVVDVQLEPGRWVHGRVVGDSGRSYEQVIRLGRDAKGLTISGECTCPARSKCRHMAAVLLYLFHRAGKDLADDDSESALPPTTPQVERWLVAVSDAAQPKNSYPDDMSQRLVYLLDVERGTDGTTPILRVASAKVSRSGEWSETVPYRIATLSGSQFAKYIRPFDVRVLRSLEQGFTKLDASFASYRLSGGDVRGLFNELTVSGRLFWSAPGSKPLQLSETRTGTGAWETSGSGDQQFHILGAGDCVLPTNPPIYVDAEAGAFGVVDCGLDPELAGQLLAGPMIRPEYSRRVRTGLAGSYPGSGIPLPKVFAPPRVVTASPSIRLRLDQSKAQYRPLAKSSQGWLRPASARLEFVYDGFVATGVGEELRVLKDGNPITFRRGVAIENRCRELLAELGWLPAEESKVWIVASDHEDRYLLSPQATPPAQDGLDQDMWSFIHRGVPRLREEGWEIVASRKVSLAVKEVERIAAELKEDAQDRILIELFSDLNGKRVDLRDAIKFGVGHQELLDRDTFYYGNGSGSLLALPSGRIREVVGSIEAIAGGSDRWLDSWSIPKARLVEADEIGDAVDMLTSAERLAEFASGLKELPEAGKAVISPRFKGQMRRYQKQGLAWLQLLSRFGMGGVLADDMGLGKTVQALAFIASQIDADEAAKPFLIVAPTSTLPNWQAEAAKFTPSLKVLKLHGPTRKQLFGEIPQADIVLTSFTLLAKDAEELHKQEFAGVILDEAQMIKNSSTHAARASYATKTDFRLAMSGTPIENNLDELWSLFRFVAPGLLGSNGEFKRDFRLPIEVGHNAEIQGRLSKRIRPFILRRTKETVAKELPKKVTVAERVELEERQRALYEQIRGSEARRIEASLADKGFDKSRMEVLEALLRLRQACCDPRLLPEELRGQETESGKLTRLMEMVDELVAQGRRALVFSQFTSMLDLIEPELTARGVEFVRLSGDTRDRATPVERFQRGECPIFLISLRAGGTGLNLTAADTVVHFDPWWNPAVENQATDRAHRIGQEKTVFVYKLVAANTVEERILELQDRKAALAEGLLESQSDISAQLTEADLQWLLTS